MGKKIRASIRAVIAPKIYASMDDGLATAMMGCNPIKNAPQALYNNPFLKL